jgi:hypothetical protein
MAKERFVPPQFLFSMYKMKGDMDRAFRWFEKAVEERDFMLPFCLTWPGKEWQMPDEPRFHQALDRLRDPQT